MAPSIAPHPFNLPSADITLRSSDGIEYQVHSLIISLASPIFAIMFELPQPKPASSNHSVHIRPVVDIAEDSKTLMRLLRLCYPVAEPDVEQLSEIIPVLQAAMKYDMERPISVLKKEIMGVAHVHPLQAWAVACRIELEDIACFAASKIPATPHTQLSPIDALQIHFDTDTTLLAGVSAGQYHRLREYIRLGEQVATDFRLLTPQRSLYRAPRQDPTPRDVFHPNASRPPDIILRCADGTEIQTFMETLCIHSPALESQIKLLCSSLQVEEDSSQPLPVLYLDTDGITLSSLLGICYHGTIALSSDLQQLASIRAIAERYVFEQVIDAVQSRWIDESQARPLEAYFAATQYGLTSYTRTAARLALAKLVDTDPNPYVPQMEDASALAYHRLLQYHSACLTVVRRELRGAWAACKPPSAGRSESGSTPRFFSFIEVLDQSRWLLSFKEKLENDVFTRDLLTELCSPQTSASPLTNSLVRLSPSLPQTLLAAVAQVKFKDSSPSRT